MENHNLLPRDPWNMRYAYDPRDPLNPQLEPTGTFVDILDPLSGERVLGGKNLEGDIFAVTLRKMRILA